jgi:predicted  nucleic acid-binding Zn-ribbon protein
MTKDDQYQNDLINLRHDKTGLQIRLDSVNKQLDMVMQENERLVDRNWELQKRIIEQSTWVK